MVFFVRKTQLICFHQFVEQNRWSSPNAHRPKRGNGNDNFHTPSSRSMKMWQTATPPPPPSISNSATGSNDTRFDDTDTKSGTQITASVGIGDTMSTLDASQRKTLPAWIRLAFHGFNQPWFIRDHLLK